MWMKFVCLHLQTKLCMLHHAFKDTARIHKLVFSHSEQMFFNIFFFFSGGFPHCREKEDFTSLSISNFDRLLNSENIKINKRFSVWWCWAGSKNMWACLYYFHHKSTCHCCYNKHSYLFFWWRFQALFMFDDVIQQISNVRKT